VRQALSYCGQEVRRHDRDRFLLSLFVPAGPREDLLAVYALNVELAHIRRAVREEMLGHIRHAWWEEAVEALYVGAPPREQPVLQALAPLIKEGHLPHDALFPLVEEYRRHFPAPPPDIDVRLEALSVMLLQRICPDALPDWRRANDIITKHRARYGARWNGWLAFKLLLTEFL